MTDTIENEAPSMLEVPPDERSLLMQRARMMGIKISNNIGLEALRLKIQNHIEGEAPVELPATVPTEVPPAIQAEALPLTIQDRRKRAIKEAMKLVRLRITNLDPKKKDLPGEIFTIGNKYIGTVRKYVPFGDQTENGYHVPYCIYLFMKARKFLHIRTTKRRGVESVETSYVPEFALEILPPLTETELKRLALQQAAADGKA
jgi:hypothetical protein